MRRIDDYIEQLEAKVERLEKALTGVLDNHHASGVPRCYCPACDAAYAALAEPDGGAGLMMAVVEAAEEFWRDRRQGLGPLNPDIVDRLLDAVAAYKGEGKSPDTLAPCPKCGHLKDTPQHQLGCRGAREGEDRS